MIALAMNPYPPYPVPTVIVFKKTFCFILKDYRDRKIQKLAFLHWVPIAYNITWSVGPNPDPQLWV